MRAQTEVGTWHATLRNSTPITSRDELVAWVEAGSKPADQFLIGTEHEKIPFYHACHSAVPYEGMSGRGGIRDLLEGMQAKLGWEPIYDRAAIIGL